MGIGVQGLGVGEEEAMKQGGAGGPGRTRWNGVWRGSLGRRSVSRMVNGVGVRPRGARRVGC